MSFTSGSYNLLAMPVNGGCTMSFAIANNDAVGVPLQFASLHGGILLPTVTITPDLPRSSDSIQQWEGWISRFNQGTVFLQFLDASTVYGHGIRYLVYNFGPVQSFVINNYGAASVAADTLVSLYGIDNEETFLVNSSGSGLIVIMGTAKNVYESVAAGFLTEPIPVVWNFQTILP